jgi:uncharacterized protein (DUF885 family)
MKHVIALGVLVALVATASGQSSTGSVTYPAKAGPGKGKHVVLLTGDEEYRSEEGLPMLAKILSQRHGFKTTVLFSLDPDGTINPKNAASLSDPAALDSADAIIMLLRFRHWSDENMARFEARLNAGTPIIALRTSTHAFNGFEKGSRWEPWNYNNQGGFGKRVLGETWLTHWGRHKVEATRGAIEDAQRDHPVLRGVSDVFGDTDVYEAYPPPDATILVRGVVLKELTPDSAPADSRKRRATDKQEQGVNDPAMPVVWTRQYKNDGGTTNRILTSTMGSATDLENEGLRRLIVNGVYWGLGLDVPARADVTYVDEYKPSFYGFDGFRKGLRPSDFELGKRVPGEPLPRPPRAPEVPPSARSVPGLAAATSPAVVATLALADDVVAGLKRESPELGTILGLPDAKHGLVQDNSLEARARRQAEEDAWRARLAKIDAKALEGTEAWVLHGYIDELLQTSIGSRVCEAELWSVDQMGGWQVRYGQLAQMQPIDSEPLRADALQRFRSLAAYVDREVVNLEEGLRRGYTAPRGNVELVIEQMTGFAADDSPYFSPATRAKVPGFTAAWRGMVHDQLAPAFRRYQAFLRNEYLPKARTTVGVSALPDGAACYRAKLREMTTLALTAEEVHKTGLAELERIKTEERAIARTLAATEDLDTLFKRMQRPEQLWKTRDEVVAQARGAAARAQAAMPKYFGRVPKTAVIVSPVAAVEEPTTADRYQAGTIDGKRPGEYQINAGRWLGQRKSDLEAVVFHETIPGHHLEISLSLERPDAHLVTKLTGNSAFSEGWGLYAERLADEMKLYSGDVDRLGMWQSRGYRASRLVVDTGLHAFGWPRQKAIDFMTALHLASDEEIASEVDRYIIWPGQATAYMTGALEIERLRAAAEQRLGSRFDIRAFHDTVLADGPVPLPLLRLKLEKLR